MLLELKLPTNYSSDDLERSIQKSLNTKSIPEYLLLNKSLDARNKRNIHWLLSINVLEEIETKLEEAEETIKINPVNGKHKVVVIGSGPAGFFSAYILQQAGFNVTIIEKGSEVNERAAGIQNFETDGIFNPTANYAFGEGGAGTFSDGKLTSRSKHINKERNYIINEYIAAGSPAEIKYLAYPHIGSDNLRIIVRNLREKFKEIGGSIEFKTTVTGVKKKSDNKLGGVYTSRGDIDADYVVFAPGHSSFELYRMLMKAGFSFKTKGFAIGYRAEHPQRLINIGRWGCEQLPGVKAAEYRLTSPADGNHPVYSFCMCPGGMVVPATTSARTNIVNGMSYYARDGKFANAGIVAGIHPDELAGKTCTPSQALDALEKLEESFYELTQGYQAPYCSIASFITGKKENNNMESSYPLGIVNKPLWEKLPKPIVESIRAGLIDFNNKLPGFNKGILLGLESKTSSPIQVLRDQRGLCEGFSNAFLIGEGSGYSGGIISSAADGVKMALSLINEHH